MAKMTIKSASEYAIKLSKLESDQERIAGKAIYSAAGMVADQMKANLEAIPEDQFRFLRDGDKLAVASHTQKEGLIDNFGISSMKVDGDGNYNVKCGFEGYIDTPPTDKYPSGLPAEMLARSIESGSSYRKKHPFARPAVAKTKDKAKEEMGRIIDEETRKIMGGK